VPFERHVQLVSLCSRQSETAGVSGWVGLPELVVYLHLKFVCNGADLFGRSENIIQLKATYKNHLDSGNEECPSLQVITRSWKHCKPEGERISSRWFLRRVENCRLAAHDIISTTHIVY
jgi:hypothetical protein